ncbi:MAG: hypothetical protein ABH851_08275 [Methanobacteriota archaeon]
MMDKTVYRFGAGMIFLFMGLSLSLKDYNPAVGAATMTFGLIYILNAVKVKVHGQAAVKGDERTRKLGAWAATYSWFATLMGVSILYWLVRLGRVDLAAEDVLGILILFMTFSLLFFRMVVAHKGDVS